MNINKHANTCKYIFKIYTVCVFINTCIMNIQRTHTHIMKKNVFCMRLIVINRLAALIRNITIIIIKALGNLIQRSVVTHLLKLSLN